jgi:hypothetical protein
MAQSLRNQNFAGNRSSNRPFSRDNRANDDREEEALPPADYWLNVGFTQVDPETGEETFVSLSRKGIPSDALKISSGSGPMSKAKNKAITMLDDRAMAMEAGDVWTTRLQVQVRRVGTTNGAAPLEEDNPFIDAIRALFAD